MHLGCPDGPGGDGLGRGARYQRTRLCGRGAWHLAAFGLAPLSGSEFGGALSDVLRIPFADAMLVRLPEGFDPVVAAALGDNAVDGFRTVHEALSAEPGAKVLVAGGGAPSVALYAVAAARALRASQVVYVDTAVDRCAVAEKLGATVVRESPELRALARRGSGSASPVRTWTESAPVSAST
jgi:threonine dehydrogenase-like Zn-dependent dehydrogenase